MTEGFLREIVGRVRDDVERGRYAVARTPVPPSRGARLSEAIRRESARGALLVEYKRVSPGSSAPRLPHRTAVEFVARTEVPGLAGYSCLATRPRFEGSVADVVAVAQAARRPVLFKDFVIDPGQVDAAADAGASAILLIARLEDEHLLTRPLTALAERARGRGLEVLLELHARSELRHVERVKPEMVGVNVRDLDTLEMAPETAAETIRAARSDRPLLGLSGVAGADDARRFWSLGVDGILVGSAVARARDPAEFLRGLARPDEGA
jgi:indole-3-glycerol phosphate synthase